MNNQINEAFSRFLSKECRPEDINILLKYVASDDNDTELKQLILQSFYDKKPALEHLRKTEPDYDDVFNRIREKIHQNEPDQVPVNDSNDTPSVGRLRTTRKWYMLAAAVFLFALLFVYLLVDNRTGASADMARQTKYKNDVEPGGNRATITLADGRTIVLDTLTTGSTTAQGDASFSKTNEGQLEFSTSENREQPLQYNVLSTPRGGMYRLVLSDGSTVYLNAASSIKFPVSFGAGERVVALTGEAYFEVASSTLDNGKRRPFLVQVSSGEADDKMQIEVLGTHFNVMAYANEARMQTTLLEGAIKVAAEGGNATLKPGDELQVDHQGMRTKHGIDTKEAVPWKDGLFRFEGADIVAVMRQVERWYDVEVAYKGSVLHHFTGEAHRSRNLSELLNVLESTGKVKFEIDGRRVMAMPQE
ncbi:FecR family protein [Segetibacter sp. 3557_3]|uniref:FecR family protein n=1 Tax=Segetibacter sp. 3557_3 TaxID=2547429 RepID=UPI0010591A01|nr:FecR family protein [Segetibacter sp. 3557_3]TDH21412.1 FecR family protein [Segetibacter sp. 3557_3]